MWAIWTQHNEISLPMSYGWISTLSTTSGKLFNAHRSFKEKTNNIWQAMQLAWKKISTKVERPLTDTPMNCIVDLCFMVDY
jgi:hypothetical protein